MISRNGVYYDLSLSPYKHEENGIIFLFSSKIHLKKFKERLQENRDIINYSLTNRFNITVRVDTLADIVLYKKIETRGFLIVNSEDFNKWENVKQIICTGETVTGRNCNG